MSKFSPSPVHSFLGSSESHSFTTLSSESEEDAEEDIDNNFPAQGIYADVQPPQPKDPRTKAKYNIISRLLFFWLNPLFYLGMKRELQQEDLYAHPLESDSCMLLARFNWYWRKELKRKRNGFQARLWLALAQCISWRLVLQGLLLLIEAGILLFQSVILGLLTEHFSIEQPSQTDTRNAYLYALGLVLLSFIVVVMHSHSFLMGQKMSMMLRIISTAAIYQKILSLSQATVGQLSVGHIVNLASNDVQRFDPVFPHFPYLWVSPLHLIVFTYLAYREVGWTAFLATGFLILQVPLQILLARFFVYLRFKSASLTDKRIHIMNEVIAGIRVIKMYAWENAFKTVVEDVRKQESDIIFKGSTIRACNLAYMIVSTSMIMWLVLTVHTSTGGQLSTRQVFTLLSLLTSLRLSSYFFVLALLGFSEGRVAIHRIQEFLEHEDIALSLTGLDYTDSASIRRSSRSCNAVLPIPHNQQSTEKAQLSSTYFADSAFINVTNMSASWSYSEDKLVLEDIHFEVNESIPLLAVIGPVGSGKSSLLHCLLGELEALKGSISVRGTVSYVSQEPWMFAGTLKENIIFGKKFDQIWYEKVLDACSLDEDIRELPLGDSTPVGERGVALSGGQKARVNLARAIYHDSEIFLLDDPLSALDVNVALHIYDNCIRGLLDNKIVVLVTHQIQFALSADKILLIKHGQQQLYSNHEELMVQGVDPSHLIGLIQDEDEEEIEEDYEREMYNYKNYEPPSPTTISMLSMNPTLSSSSDDVQSASFSVMSSAFANDAEVVESNSPVLTPLAFFSKSMREMQNTNADADLMKEQTNSSFLPIPEADETTSVGGMSRNDISSGCNGTVSTNSQAKDQDLPHEGEKSHSSSAWPFATSSPYIQRASLANTDELPGNSKPTGELADPSSSPFAHKPPSSPAPDAWPFANKPPTSPGPNMPPTSPAPAAWPFANKPPTSPAPAVWPFANKPPKSPSTSPSPGAWPFAHKSPKNAKNSRAKSLKARAKRFASKSRLSPTIEAWPFAKKSPDGVTQNPHSPLVHAKVHASSSLSKATVISNPANTSLQNSLQSNELPTPTAAPKSEYNPDINLLPPTPSPDLIMENKRKKKKPSSLLLISSSADSAGSATSPYRNPSSPLLKSSSNSPNSPHTHGKPSSLLLSSSFAESSSPSRTRRKPIPLILSSSSAESSPASPSRVSKKPISLLVSPAESNSSTSPSISRKPISLLSPSSAESSPTSPSRGSRKQISLLSPSSAESSPSSVSRKPVSLLSPTESEMQTSSGVESLLNSPLQSRTPTYSPAHDPRKIPSSDPLHRKKFVAVSPMDSRSPLFSPSFKRTSPMNSPSPFTSPAHTRRSPFATPMHHKSPLASPSYRRRFSINNTVYGQSQFAMHRRYSVSSHMHNKKSPAKIPTRTRSRPQFVVPMHLRSSPDISPYQQRRKSVVGPKFSTPMHQRRSPYPSPPHKRKHHRRFSFASVAHRKVSQPVFNRSRFIFPSSPMHNRKSLMHSGISPLPSPMYSRRSPMHTGISPLPSPMYSRRSPMHTGISPLPSPMYSRRSPMHTGIYPLPSPMYSRRSPMHTGISPLPSPMYSRRSPIHSRISPLPSPMHNGISPLPSPMYSRRSPMHSRMSQFTSPGRKSALYSRISPPIPDPIHSRISPFTSPMLSRKSTIKTPRLTVSTMSPFASPRLDRGRGVKVNRSATMRNPTPYRNSAVKTPRLTVSTTSPFSSPRLDRSATTRSPRVNRSATMRSPRPCRNSTIQTPRLTDSAISPFSSPMLDRRVNRSATMRTPRLGRNSTMKSPTTSSPRLHRSATTRTPRPSRLSPFTSPRHNRNSTITSPGRLSRNSTIRSPGRLSRKSTIRSPGRSPRKTPIPDEGLTLNIEPGRFDAASIYTVRSIGSRAATRLAMDETIVSENGDSESDLAQESRSGGTISIRTYYNFFKAGGGLLLLAATLLILILGEAGIVVSDWWLSDWANCFSTMTQVNGLANLSTGNSSICSLGNNERIGVYTTTTVIATVFSFSRAILFCFVCINASRVLHNRMFKAVLHAKVLFFDLNPVGRILNRFSKDIGYLDDLLPYSFCEFVLLFLRCLAVIITAIASNGWLTFPAAAIIVIFMLLRLYYLKSARDVKRLEAIARSPVYAHLSTTIQGLSIIRSYQREDVALKQLHKFQNQHSQSWYLYLVMVRWFGLRIDTLSVAFLAAVAFISIPLAAQLDAGLVGLSLTYAISLADMLQYTIRLSAEVENTMISAERVMEYGNLESESAESKLFQKQEPHDNWPSEGEIKMENVMFQYAQDCPMVLKDLNFVVKKSEKVGIVGRTGAGKSSLISVLYRLAEPYGQITIDGVDTKTIGLHDLRKKMSIIPQDPVLFSGTMRYNLDPFGEYSDAELWGVLEQVQLKTAVEELEGQLSGKVSEGGCNFSVGQRQLVCLARALLRKNKILILDEATANVDPRTDGIIQKAIHETFSACTTLVIAHRLDTIMDADKIILLKNGRIKEFDSPYKLLQDPNSRFYMMVEKTGLTASGRLHQMALESHLRKMFKKNGRITPAQAKGGIKRISALFAQSLLQRSVGSGPFALSKLQERRASILSSNSFPRALNEMGVGGAGVINANDPNLQSLRLPSDPNVGPKSPDTDDEIQD